MVKLRFGKYGPGRSIWVHGCYCRVLNSKIVVGRRDIICLGS